MEATRKVGIGLTALALAAAGVVPAHAGSVTAAVQGQDPVYYVTGGGFDRADLGRRERPGKSRGKAHLTKRMLVVDATDEASGDVPGRALYVEQTPGTPPEEHSQLRVVCAGITLSSNGPGGIARMVATSNFGGTDRFFAVRIDDNGEPGKGRDQYRIKEDSSLDSMLRTIACDADFAAAIEGFLASGDARTIEGGNFTIGAR